MPSLEDEIGKFIGFLIMGLTGKDPHQQTRLVNANDNFQTLVNESEKHMQWLVKQMEDGSIFPMIWQLNKLKHVSERFEEILREEQDSRERRQWWQKEK